MKLSEEEFDKTWNLFSIAIYRFCYSLLQNQSDAEEATQETFLYYWQKQKPNEKGIKSYLMTIAYHKAADLWEERKKKGTLSFDEETVGTEEGVSLQTQQLFRAVNTLPTKYRKPIVMFYFGELSSDEIASALHLSKGTVLKRLERGRKKIKEAMENER